MENLQYLYGLLFAVLALHSSDSTKDCFTAAVYEHVQQGDEWLDDPQSVIRQNLDVYKTAAMLASSAGADILVFPESGIFQASSSRERTRLFLEAVPDEMHTLKPCRNASFSNQTMLTTLSCIAAERKMYIVADMGEIIKCDAEDQTCPSDGFYQYHTSVVFNDKGYLIAKYRKYHLFFEFGFDIPKQQDFVTFDTSFGKFGILVCFDLIYKDPGTTFVEKHGVNTVLFPTHWFDEAPFLTSHQYQQGWTIGNKANLLAANINRPWTGSTGSGIYDSQHGAVIYQREINKSSANLLVASLKSKNSVNASCSDIKLNIPVSATMPNETLPYFFKQTEVPSFEHVALKETSGEVQLCQNELCCKLKYSFKSKPKDLIFGVLSRLRPVEQVYRWYEEGCGVFSYSMSSKRYLISNSIKVESLVLSGNFSTKYVYPSVMEQNFNLVSKKHWQYDRELHIVSISVTDLKQHMTSVALYGRPFERDLPFV